MSMENLEAQTAPWGWHSESSRVLEGEIRDQRPEEAFWDAENAGRRGVD